MYVKYKLTENIYCNVIYICVLRDGVVAVVFAPRHATGATPLISVVSFITGRTQYPIFVFCCFNLLSSELIELKVHHMLLKQLNRGSLKYDAKIFKCIKKLNSIIINSNVLEY